MTKLQKQRFYAELFRSLFNDSQWKGTKLKGNFQNSCNSSSVHQVFIFFHKLPNLNFRFQPPKSHNKSVRCSNSTQLYFLVSNDRFYNFQKQSTRNVDENKKAQKQFVLLLTLYDCYTNAKSCCLRFHLCSWTKTCHNFMQLAKQFIEQKRTCVCKKTCWYQNVLFFHLQSIFQCFFYEINSGKSTKHPSNLFGIDEHDVNAFDWLWSKL